MKIVAIGDIHGKNIWKKIVEKEQDADKIIFIGDYWDSFDESYVEQLHNFNEIIAYKKHNADKVVLLIGNHDGYIHDELNQWSISGYQKDKAIFIKQEMQQNKDLFTMCYCYKNTLFTHAGISPIWLGLQGIKDVNIAPENLCDFINTLWKHKPISFAFNGNNPFGDDRHQTPIWIRPASLIKASYKFTNQLNQVVGHTAGNGIKMKMSINNSKYYFIDCLDTSDEYLVIEDGEFKVIQL